MKHFFIISLCFLAISLSAQETGCMYQQADNYSSTATVDDGSCVFGSGLCGVGTMWNEDTQTCVINESSCSWQPDSNADGLVGVSDLLDFLLVYGDADSDGDGVYDSLDDCIDMNACNYFAVPTEICEYYINELGECFACGDLIVHENYDYSTVLIGDQCWFAENCRYLPSVSPLSEWSINSDPYYYILEYQGTDVEAAMSTSNYATYGVLYNWPAVMTEGICPSGWHIPSDEEFTQLTDFLGGYEVAGNRMKDDVQWNGSNSSGFKGLPGRYCHFGGWLINTRGYWWSTSEDTLNTEVFSFYRSLTTDDEVGFGTLEKYVGMSARCIKD